jgi:hypothetical protein
MLFSEGRRDGTIPSHIVEIDVESGETRKGRVPELVKNIQVLCLHS